MAGDVSSELILVRHGESVGNVLRENAEALGADRIPIERRDPDVELTDLGRAQAEAVGRWLAAQPRRRAPRAVLCSPYVRALQTATIAVDVSGLDLALDIDERVRDRELGILDGLTSSGVRSRLPDEAERRRRLGKFYYRPPGGESWADVALRLRSVLGDLRAADGPLLVVTHDAVVLLVRYVLERMSESELLAIASSTSVANGSVTRLVRARGAARWEVAEFNDTAHLTRFGSAVTEHAAERDVHPR